MKAVFLGLAVVMLAGCSTSQVSADKAKPVPVDRVLAFSKKPSGPHGTVIVTRDTGFVGGACYVGVLIDGKFSARIDTGEVVRLYVPAGEHLIGLSGDEHSGGTCGWGSLRKEQSTIVQDGSVKKFRIGGDTQAGLDIRPTSM
ncbi:hypothetical protein K5D33_07255 [Pseudomonas cichorii]|nr:hypothetical protein [Pseudomonas cichorii]MBX8534520.1 hypothetical protein [Pseudomonas cichorii]